MQDLGIALSRAIIQSWLYKVYSSILLMTLTISTTVLRFSAMVFELSATQICIVCFILYPYMIRRLLHAYVLAIVYQILLS